MNLADIAAAAGLRSPVRHQLFINGQFVDSASGETLAANDLGLWWLASEAEAFHS